MSKPPPEDEKEPSRDGLGKTEKAIQHPGEPVNEPVGAPTGDSDAPPPA
jgi:hypothetical protein